MLSNEASIIQPGWQVFGADGARLGDVKAPEGHHLVVRTGALLRHGELHVPISLVASARDRAVQLSVTHAGARALGFDRPHGMLLPRSAAAH